MPKAKRSVKIDTVPFPEHPLSLEIRIPIGLIREFEREVRVVVRHPWIVGIPVPEKLLTPDLMKKLGPGLELMITPTLKSGPR